VRIPGSLVHRRLFGQVSDNESLGGASVPQKVPQGKAVYVGPALTSFGWVATVVWSRDLYSATIYSKHRERIWQLCVRVGRSVCANSIKLQMTTSKCSILRIDYATLTIHTKLSPVARMKYDTISFLRSSMHRSDARTVTPAIICP
jgi:hypothetical protein